MKTFIVCIRTSKGKQGIHCNTGNIADIDFSKRFDQNETYIFEKIQAMDMLGAIEQGDKKGMTMYAIDEASSAGDKARADMKSGRPS